MSNYLAEARVVKQSQYGGYISACNMLRIPHSERLTYSQYKALTATECRQLKLKMREQIRRNQ